MISAPLRETRDLLRARLVLVSRRLRCPRSVGAQGKAIARTLIAKELGAIVYHVLTRQEQFNGRFRGLQLRRTKLQRWPRLASPPA